MPCPENRPRTSVLSATTSPVSFSIATRSGVKSERWSGEPNGWADAHCSCSATRIRLGAGSCGMPLSTKNSPPEVTVAVASR
jgi:hypothetical protein